jgi:peptide/nickel transport system substrate-binding protein
VLGGSVWVADNLDKTVTRIDAGTRTRVAVTTVGNLPTAVVAARHSVWVSAAGDARLVELDGSSARSLRSVPVGSSPLGLAIAGGRMWAVEQPFESPTHFGGTLVAEDEFDPQPIVDPQYAYIALNAFSIVFDGLVRMDPVSGPAGYELVPDLATTLPLPSDGGLSYTFTLRPGVHYSNGQLVQASDFRRGITRAVVAMAAGMGYPFGYLSAIAGANACYQHPQRCNLAVTANDRTGTVTIRLDRPDPDLLAELSLPVASPVPSGTPMHNLGGHAPASTGPYMFARVAPNDVHLVRNPRFHPWSTAAQPRGYPDQIVLKGYATADVAVRAFKRGGIDLVGLAPFNTPSTQLAELARQYPGQIHTNSIPVLHYVLLNRRRPPFNDPIARKAFAAAIDRTTIERILGSGHPFCGFVLPDYPGYSAGCTYFLHGDLARARALLRTARPYQGTLVVTSPGTVHFSGLGAYLYHVALSLGYHAVFRPLPVNQYVATPYDVSVSAWAPDFPAASGFYLPEFKCASIGAGAVNLGQVCDRQLDAEALHAQLEQTSNPAQAQQDWVQVYRKLQDITAAIPTATDSRTVLVSSRVGNYQCHPIMWDLLDQMWVK